MKHAAVDKKVAGIIRWLERLNESYKSGSMESALMDAECAKADLENLTQDFWEKVKPKEIKRRERKSIFVFLRPAFVAVLMLMMMVAPLSRDAALSLPESLPVVAEVPVHPAEVVAEVPLAVSVVEVKEEKPETPSPAPKRAAKKAAAKRTQTAAAQKAPREAPKVAKAKTVPYDKVFSLMQTGQRALKNNNSVVKVQ